MDNTTRAVIEELAAAVELSDEEYETAERRYKDLGEWFGGKKAECAAFDPHVYPQGSFRLGTAIRGAEYDLDFGCRLRKGVTTGSHTQEQLKTMVGNDLRAYRRERGIQQDLEEMHRCWRLKYRETNDTAFHMDCVPSIPAEESRRRNLAKAIRESGSDDVLAENVSQHAGAITDNRHEHYRRISPDWRISNSEGYALWFESRMKLAAPLLQERARLAKAVKIDHVPARRWRSPLQMAVQILKKHRDEMFAEAPECKPISIIITTLAARAYRGEDNVADALHSILAAMESHVGSHAPRIPNPVNPVEDFADKWDDPAYGELELERNFRRWVAQAQHDFARFAEGRNATLLSEQARRKFGAEIGEQRLRKHLGSGTAPVSTSPKSHVISGTPAQPWRRC